MFDDLTYPAADSAAVGDCSVAEDRSIKPKNAGRQRANYGAVLGPDCAEAAELRERVAELSGTVNVATAELADQIARVIEIEAWSGWGYKSLEHWVTVHCGVSSYHARALVTMARRAEAFPVTMGLFREGRLSEDQLRPIVRHVPDGYDKGVAEFAKHATVPQVERTMRRYRFGDDKPPTAKQLANPSDEEATGKQGTDDSSSDDELSDVEDEQAKEREKRDQAEMRDREERQYCSFGHDDRGFWGLHARLTPEQGEIVRQALGVFRDEIFRERDGKATWHDALVRMAEIAIAAHGDSKDRRGHDRYQVMLHIKGEDLDRMTSTELMPPSRYFHLGPAVSQSLAKYMSCDASVRLIIDRDGRSVSIGRKQHTVPDHTRRVVEDRDGGRCVIPGCDTGIGIQVHHLVHWEDGGATDTPNLACLCSWHHQAVHRGEITTTGNADIPGGLTILNKWGKPMTAKPKPPRGPAPTGTWIHPPGESFDEACVHFPKAAA